MIIANPIYDDSNEPFFGSATLGQTNEGSSE